MKTCANCGRFHRSRRPFGWCDGCYQRWLGAEKPETGPPPLKHPDNGSELRAEASRKATRASFEARLAEYREGHARQPDAVAARQMGVTVRTIERYRRILGQSHRGRLPYQERLAEFREMTLAGVPPAKIAAVLRVDRRTVDGYRRKARAEGWLT